MIRCEPPRSPFWQEFAVSLLWVMTVGGILFLLLLSAFEITAGTLASPRVKWATMLSAATISILLLAIFVRWERQRWYWVLTDDALIGGKTGRQVLPLASIAKIVPGLPGKVGILLALNRFVHRDLWAAITVDRRRALVLKFVDGSCMAFHVYRCVGGEALMDALRERLADRLDPLYEYSSGEQEALKYPEWNRAVRA